MEKYFANYNQSLALKELGYDEPCFGRYQIGGDFVLSHTERYVISNGTDRTKYFILRPLKSQVFEWFREKYNLHNVPLGTVRNSDNKVIYYIGKPNTISLYTKVYDTYEEAESACIDALIEHVKQRL